MALKSFMELYKLDVSSFISKKPTFRKQGNEFVEASKKLDYIEWATVIRLLYENGAEKVSYHAEKNKNDYPLFTDSNGKNPFVRVVVEIDEDEHIIDFPVIDGTKVIKEPDQLDIHKAQQRAMVKCVAINTGLGLSLWSKEEEIITPEPAKQPRELPLFPNDSDKFNKAVMWLKTQKTVDIGISKLRKTYTIDMETEINLISAAES